MSSASRSSANRPAPSPSDFTSSSSQDPLWNHILASQVQAISFRIILLRTEVRNKPFRITLICKTPGVGGVPVENLGNRRGRRVPREPACRQAGNATEGSLRPPFLSPLPRLATRPQRASGRFTFNCSMSFCSISCISASRRNRYARRFDATSRGTASNWFRAISLQEIGPRTGTRCAPH